MWMKVDDGLHAHRKTRAVTKSHHDKRRDAAPMGLWVLAGSWAAQNRTDGWVPKDELDRWDEEWEALVSRLVAAGYWWPAERDGEPGYGFNDWLDYNPESEAASRSGSFGNHVRWHEHKGIVNPDCDHCPKEPDRPESGGDPPAIRGGGSRDSDVVSGLDQPSASEGGAPRPSDSVSAQVSPHVSGGDIGGRSGGESGSESRTVALPQPDPTRARPEPDPNSCASASAEREFEDWYAAYPRKRGKGQAAKAYRAARKKASAETLLAAIQQQGPALTARGADYCPYPATWLNGERWNDQPDSQMPQPMTRVQEHLTLVQQLAAEEAEQPTLPQIGNGR